jgi:hypothetical protein
MATRCCWSGCGGTGEARDASVSQSFNLNMDASGFGTLASHFPDRTVITYDPRGLGRSSRNDGRVDTTPTVQ